MKKTSVIKSHTITPTWHIVDATDKILGRMASRIASVLRGKHRPEFTPHASHGDYVIVINCEKIRVTGNKMTDKKYYSHSQYMGNLYETSLKDMMRTHPDRVISEAVERMLPKNRLANDMIKRLRVVIGDKHEFAAQKPTPLTL